MPSKDALIEDEATIDVGGVLPELGVSSGGPVILAGRYLLLGLLGAGGMGTVYRARDLDLGEEIAVKVLRRELVANPAVVARFKQEVRIARRVTHRNVARTFDIGEHGGERFITMEYVEGESLADRLAKRGKIPLGEALDLAGSICAGLAAAHAAGIVHRDLKPENVLIEPNGRVVLTDFGVALTFDEAEGDTVVDASGELVGTPVYMAPEQVEGRVDIDMRADVYSLGAMLFEMITGERPWRGDTAWAVASARLHAPPPDPRTFVPELPEPVAHVVARAMSKSRDDRYRDVEDMATELAGISLPSGPVSMRGYRAPLPSMPDLPVEIGAKAVAVLPFAWNVPDDEVFARAMMLDLIDLLAGVEGLRVRGPRGTMPLAGAERDVRAIGQSLGVQAVVDGAVRRGGGRMQVVARLTAVADGFQLWASRFERVDEDWFDVITEVGRGVMGALTVRDRGVALRPLVEPARVAEYATARCLAFGGHDAAAYGRLASMRTGDDARLLSLVAAAELGRSRTASGNEAQAARDDARAHATQAASLAPDLAAPRATLAHLALIDNALTEAARATRDALRLGPGNAELQALFGRLLALVGRPRQGLTFLDAASTLEPSLESAWSDGLLVRGLLGEWTALERAIGAGPRSEARDLTLARVALWHPDPGLAHAVGRAAGLSPRAAALTRTGQHADKVSAARAAASPGAPLALGRRIEALQLEAELLARMQEEDAALAAVEDAVQLGLTDVAWLERCPLLAPLSARLAPLVPEVARRAESVRLVLRTTGGRG